MAAPGDITTGIIVYIRTVMLGETTAAGEETAKGAFDSLMYQ